jgi:hypothetical protein
VRNRLLKDERKDEREDKDNSFHSLCSKSRPRENPRHLSGKAIFG